MKLNICAKFHVNRMNCVKSRRWGGGGGLTPLKCSCNYFFSRLLGLKTRTILEFQKYKPIRRNSNNNNYIITTIMKIIRIMIIIIIITIKTSIIK